MRKLLVILMIVSVVALVLGLGAAYATDGTDTATSVVSLSITDIVRLGIDNPTSSVALAQDADSETAFDNSKVDFASGICPTLTVTANKKWKLSASSSGFNANGTYQKDVSDLLIKNTGAHTLTTGYTSFLTVGGSVDLASNTTTGTKNEANQCLYEIKLSYFKDIPGTYSATVTYTLATLAS